MKDPEKIKKERFKRLAEHRVNQVIKRLRVLTNCSNRSHYKYTEKEVKKMFEAIKEEVETARRKFIKSKTNFKL
jgi:hypothetical protein